MPAKAGGIRKNFRLRLAVHVWHLFLCLAMYLVENLKTFLWKIINTTVAEMQQQRDRKHRRSQTANPASNYQRKATGATKKRLQRAAQNNTAKAANPRTKTKHWEHPDDC